MWNFRSYWKEMLRTWLLVKCSFAITVCMYNYMFTLVIYTAFVNTVEYGQQFLPRKERPSPSDKKGNALALNPAILKLQATNCIEIKFMNFSGRVGVGSLNRWCSRKCNINFTRSPLGALIAVLLFVSIVCVRRVAQKLVCLSDFTGNIFFSSSIVS